MELAPLELISAYFIGGIYKGFWEMVVYHLRVLREAPAGGMSHWRMLLGILDTELSQKAVPSDSLTYNESPLGMLR